MPETAATVTDALIRGMEQRAKDPRLVWGIPWGFNGLDRLTGGIHTEEMSILMARPGVGKSFFLGQVAIGVAKYLLSDDGRKRAPGAVVRLVLCEMSARQFQERLVCQAAGVHLRRVRAGRLTPAQQAAYREHARLIGDLPIEYLDAPLSLDDTTRWVTKGAPCAWWAVDYIGIHPAGDARLEAEQTRKVAYLSEGFRALARGHAPGLVLAQMNRDIEKRKPEERRPQLSDLRDSGRLEQDASGVVMGLYRPDLYTRVADEDLARPKAAELCVLKQRNGPIGTIELLWFPTMPGYVDTSDLFEEDADV